MAKEGLSRKGTFELMLKEQKEGAAHPEKTRAKTWHGAGLDLLEEQKGGPCAGAYVRCGDKSAAAVSGGSRFSRVWRSIQILSTWESK